MILRRLLLSLAVAISLAGTFLAQSKKMSESDFYKIVSNAETSRHGMPRRERTTKTGYYTGVSEEVLWEFGSNDSSRWLVVTTTNGRETDRTEMIQVGDFHYVRQSDGSWRKKADRGIGVGEGIGLGFGEMQFPVRKVDDYVDVGPEKVNAIATEHYRHTLVETFAPSDLPAERVTTSDYWFNSDGLLVKEIHEGNVAGSIRRYKVVTEYEYDKNLKITAPVVGQPQPEPQKL